MTSNLSSATPDRTKVLAILGRAIEEMRTSVIERMLTKDLSLALEQVTVMGRSSHFALACLNQGYLGGVEAALNAGLDINEQLATLDGTNAPKTTLLETAVINQDASAVQWLLKRKACIDPFAEFFANIEPEREPVILRALRDSLSSSSSGGLGAFRIPLALLDAGADVSPQARYYPNSEPAMILLAKESWKGRELAMAKMMSIVKEKGGCVDARSPRTRMTPIRVALGQRNITALCTLIDLGAKTYDETIGVDIIEKCAASDFGEEITLVQAAIMRRVAREQALSMANKAPSAGQASSASETIDPSIAARRNERRRVPQL